MVAMSDIEESAPRDRRLVFGEPRATFEELHTDPAVGYVVHRVAGRPEHLADVWAWCQVEEGRPGYTSVTFTRTDGHTPTEPYPDQPDRELRLGAVLFRVWC
jgi:hypothetical protein